ncbi:MAG: hypothetical protein O3A53_01900 [Acidobacteria bacterium]|nr:hypothetical protein [Acidobacteriota bacterium]MDA1233534.1 hypothetical protein [Acidobacteriota bacterium]
MVSKRLIDSIEQNAHRLAQDLVESLRRDPNVPAYALLSDQQYQGVVQDLYGHLGQWLSSRTWHKLQVTYERKGRERFHGGIPLEQLVYSLTRTKQNLLDFIRGALPGCADERDLELQLVLSVSEFFDRAIYHTTAGYEDARRTVGAAPDLPTAAHTEASVARATGSLASESVPDSDLGQISRGGDIGETSG